jgi:hypothetical protein
MTLEDKIALLQDIQLRIDGIRSDILNKIKVYDVTQVYIGNLKSSVQNMVDVYLDLKKFKTTCPHPLDSLYQVDGHTLCHRCNSQVKVITDKV